ncbi:type II secretion system protein [Kamptonema cortianum]|nr:type II secretion system protein [Geitlerinema splendidum]MDK3156056.1 type II secretion system protein [Kamptonema cortianum]
MKRHAFTLIELLVVIGVMLIITAIIFPVYAGAKRAALRTERLNRIKQIGLALDLYRGDYDGYTVSSDPQPGYDWPSLLLPYTKSEEIVKNPALPPQPSSPVVTGYGFALNLCMVSVAYVATQNPYQVVETASLERSTAHASNGLILLTTHNFDKILAPLYPGYLPVGGRFLSDHDSGGSIILYWDGSVKWKRVTEDRSLYNFSCSTTTPENPHFAIYIKRED